MQKLTSMCIFQTKDWRTEAGKFSDFTILEKNSIGSTEHMKDPGV
ncbi:MAG: hypothetical protein ACI9GB_003818 [Halioglobus sp.]|jgi:hypothetical protein